MASVAVKSQSGDVQQLTLESFAVWKRRVGKDTGFVLKLSENDERLVLTRGQMRALPTGSFEGLLVRRNAIADPLLTKKFRGCDVWKGA